MKKNIQTIIKEINANKNSKVTLDYLEEHYVKEPYEPIVFLTSGQHLNPDDLCSALKNLPEEITSVDTMFDEADFPEDNLTEEDIFWYYVDAGFDIDYQECSQTFFATWNR